MDFPKLELLEQQIVLCKSTVPYIPTFLSFREYAPLSLAYTSLKKIPDLCFVDAHGRAHPQKLGAASHFGVLRDVPTIGVAKKLLCGMIQSSTGSYSNITLNGEIIGASIVSKAGCKPIFVSIGHRISLDSAVKLTQKSLTRYRLPEPIRLAHRLANETRRKLKSEG